MEEIIEILYREELLQMQTEEGIEDGEFSAKAFYQNIKKQISGETLCLVDTMLSLIKSKQDQINFEAYKRGVKTGIQLMIEIQERK